MANPIRISQRKDLTVSTEPPVAFLNNHITEVNGKFAELQPIYSPERDKFIEATDKALIPIEETEEMRRQQKLFLESVEKFEKSNKGVDTGIRLQTSAVHTWDDVIKQLKRMEDKYNNLKDVSVLDRTRSCLRQMSHWRKPCERWLQARNRKRREMWTLTDSAITAPTYAVLARFFALRRHQDCSRGIA